jgi:hypothetical protein
MMASPDDGAEVTMRFLQALRCTAFLATLAMPAIAAAQDAFDACTFFTAEDAEKVLGAAAAPEPVNPKAKRPKVILQCSYSASKEGKNVAATALFRFSKTDPESQRAFEDARLQLQTKPMLISGAEAFWSSKTGQLYVRKGRTAITLAVGPAKLSDRDIDQAKKLAELLVKKL